MNLWSRGLTCASVVRVVCLVFSMALLSTASWSQQASLTEGQPQPAATASPTPNSQPASEAPKKDDVASAAPASPAVKYDPLTYHIGVEDELKISVWHEQDLTSNVVVRPDGMITMPLLNDLKVTGMTTRQLQDTLTQKLKDLDFVKEPQVTIVVLAIRSRKVYLVGQAVKPGTYTLNDTKTVLQLLAEAGGPGPYAKLASIYVIRQQNGVRQRLPFNYKKAISGKDLSDDFALQPGDMVVVP